MIKKSLKSIVLFFILINSLIFSYFILNKYNYPFPIIKNYNINEDGILNIKFEFNNKSKDDDKIYCSYTNNEISNDLNSLKWIEAYDNECNFQLVENHIYTIYFKMITMILCNLQKVIN